MILNDDLSMVVDVEHSSRAKKQTQDRQTDRQHSVDARKASRIYSRTHLPATSPMVHQRNSQETVTKKRRTWRIFLPSGWFLGRGWFVRLCGGHGTLSRAYIRHRQRVSRAKLLRLPPRVTR